VITLTMLGEEYHETPHFEIFSSQLFITFSYVKISFSAPCFHTLSAYNFPFVFILVPLSWSFHQGIALLIKKKKSRIDR